MSDISKILIVDDDESIRNALQLQLEKDNFSIVVAADGEEGLALARTEKPDVILLDIMMPKIDGLQMLDQLRASDDWGRRVPVILLTNLTDTEKVAEAVGLGVYDYLVKSDWRLEDVAGVVREKITGKKSE